MVKTTTSITRQQKLAQKLRENLKRRKMQKRRRDEQTTGEPDTGHSEKIAKSEAK